MDNSTEPDLEVDVLVLGSGIAGMTVAGTAAEAGVTVLVADRAPELGGSSVISGGYVWTADDEADFLKYDPEGDLEKYRLLRDGFEPALDWVRGLGVLVGPLEHGILGFGSGHGVDVPHLVRRVRTIVESAEGFVMTGTEGVRLLRESDRVVGAVLRDTATGEETAVAASSIVLATGGVHASAELRERFGLPGAAGLLVRGNPYSEGGGVLLGLEAGGVVREKKDGYYGHPIPYPLDTIDKQDLTALVMYHVEHSMLVNAAGARFVDESDGYWIAAMELARQGHAVLISDEKVRQEQVLHPELAGYDHDPGVDKGPLAQQRGANYARADTLEELGQAISAWGYDGAAAVATVEAFNAGVEADVELDPPRERNRDPLSRPPFEAVEVQASITFAYAGLLTGDDGEVLDASGTAIPGLYANGIDAALNAWGSTGGLVRGLVLGRRVGAAVVARASEASVGAGA